MGNVCSILSIKNICNGKDISVIDLEDNRNKNGNNNLIKDSKIIESNMLLNAPNNLRANNNLMIQNHSTTDNNDNNNDNNNIANKKLSVAQINLLNIDKDKDKNDSIKKTKTVGFSNFLNDNVSFNNFGKIDKNDVFEIHYISIKDNYNENMIDYLNQIRNDPNSILEDINNILKK